MVDSTERPVVRIVTIGGMFTANKGAASMLYALLDNLPTLLGPCRFHVLTLYPGEDLQERPDPDVAVVPYRPWELALVLLPLALLVAVARLFRLPSRAPRVHPALRAIAEADLVVDVAGISFVDGRPLPILVYNTLMSGIPLLLGARVVKCSQALGPFRTPLNRLAARVVLSRLAAVTARGDTSFGHLRELGLRTSAQATDLAFTMSLPETARERAAQLLSEHGVPGRFVAVVPSNVVEGYCRARGIDYLGQLAALADRIAARGEDVLLLAHAARPGRPGSRMNDLPLVHRLRERTSHERCLAIERSLPPDVLRALIERAEQLVTSRFHAMISALAVKTPVLVIGWSHKYDEALAEFGLESWGVDFGALEEEGLLERFDELRAASPAVRARISEALPRVAAEARGSLEAIAASLELRGDRT